MNGKKESDFFFNHKLANFNPESYLQKNSGFNPIIKSNCKKELVFFFNHKLHQIKNTIPVAKPLCKQNAIPIQKLCNKWIQIYRRLSQQRYIWLFTLIQRWWFNRLFYSNDRRWKWIKHFLIAPYPPLLIGRSDEEYDLMINKLRNPILKASPHARIWRQIGINEIDKRNRRLTSYAMHLHHQIYLTM